MIENKQIVEPVKRASILDMDGTLYSFRGKTNQTFSGSEFYGRIKSNAYGFFQQTLGISEKGAISEFNRVKEKYNGELSLGVEQEYGIDRYTYFNNTWDIDPAEFIETDGDVREALNVLKGRMALLTAAPRIWAMRVLNYLKVEDLFTNVYTGEPDLRKPNPAVFQMIAGDFGLSTAQIISIGDQEYSDIIPAKSIGMKTVRIGPEQGVADYRIDSIQQLAPLLKGVGWI